MYHPLDVLRREHRVIDQMSACLSQLANCAEASGELDVTSASEIVDFFHHFADGSHHAKEEIHLIPMMEARGFSRDGGPTADMRSEHRSEHELLDAMKNAAGTVVQGRGDRYAVGRFVECARRFIVSVRDHIEMENRCMFPMAEQFLSRDDLHALQLAFLEMDAGNNDKNGQQYYVEAAHRLAKHLGVTSLADIDEIRTVACFHGMGRMETEENDSRPTNAIDAGSQTPS